MIGWAEPKSRQPSRPRTRRSSTSTTASYSTSGTETAWGGGEKGAQLTAGSRYVCAEAGPAGLTGPPPRPRRTGLQPNWVVGGEGHWRPRSSCSHAEDCQLPLLQSRLLPGVGIPSPAPPPRRQAGRQGEDKAFPSCQVMGGERIQRASKAETQTQRFPHMQAGLSRGWEREQAQGLVKAAECQAGWQGWQGLLDSCSWKLLPGTAALPPGGGEARRGLWPWRLPSADSHCWTQAGGGVYCFSPDDPLPSAAPRDIPEAAATPRNAVKGGLRSSQAGENVLPAMKSKARRGGGTGVG